MPKLQAGCTLTAQDGMVVRTAADVGEGGRGPERDARVHPRQPPARLPGLRQGRRVPAAGPDLPLRPRQDADDLPEADVRQADPDLAARSRSTASAASSATAARASRRDVAEDGQLVAREPRRARRDRDVRGRAVPAPFSGNVIELCPVGALTSTQYRFEARPWEIQNVPTVCGLCPVGCNISATTREGKVKRILSRNHPEVDEGWLCDKGRFAYPHLCADDRIVDPLERVARAGSSRALAGTTRSTRRGAAARRRQGRIVTALSGSETVEQAYALGKLLRQGLGAHSAVLPEATSHGARRLPRAALDDRRRRDRRRRRRRAGRRPRADRRSLDPARRAATAPRSSTIGPSRGSAATKLAAERGSAAARDRARVLIWSGRAVAAARGSPSSATRSGFDDKPGCAAFHLPATPNGRGVADAWAACRGRGRGRTRSRSAC